MPTYSRVLFFLMIIVGVPACGGPPRPPISDLDAMQGRWVLTDALIEGEKVELMPEEMAPTFIEIKGGRYIQIYPTYPSINGGEGIIESTFTLNERCKPKEIDLATKFNDVPISRLGLYKLDGDVLQLCFPNKFYADFKGQMPQSRPTTFETTKANGFGTLTFRRVNKK